MNVEGQIVISSFFVDKKASSVPQPLFQTSKSDATFISADLLAFFFKDFCAERYAMDISTKDICQ